MKFLGIVYNLLISLVGPILEIVALFNTKLKLFVEGRKSVFQKIESKISETDRVIWIHTASLGEFEQGLPILKSLKKEYPKHTFLLTFFSPSGYEVKKDSKVADIIAYLPLDTSKNARKFVSLVKPQLAVFVKYEIWPNYLRTLESSNIPTLLVSALFKKEQIYFKWYGGFMRESLKRFTKIFVQNLESQKFAKSIGIDAIVSGDTRFDRVAEIIQDENALDFMEKFKGDHFCFVIGSSWPEDENNLLDFINNTSNIKTVIAPHNIKQNKIADLRNYITKKTILYSEIEETEVSLFDVLIVDTIGLLTKIYSYADMAYVGGGFKTGLHNTLEPAAFGIPVIIGPYYNGFAEAVALVEKGSVLSVKKKEELNTVLIKLVNNTDFRIKTGKVNRAFLKENVGATKTIVGQIKSIL